MPSERDLIAMTFGAVLVMATLVVGNVPAADPVGQGVVPAVTAPGWSWRVDGEGDVELVDGLVHLEARSAGSRAVAWFHLPSGAGEADEWLLTGKLWVPRPGRSARVVVAAPGGAVPVWIGSQRIDSHRSDRPGLTPLNGEVEWAEVDLALGTDLTDRPVQVGLVLKGPEAEAWLAEVRLVPGRPRLLRRVSVPLLVLGWLLLAVGVGRRMGWPVAVVGLVLGAGVVIPAPWLAVLFEALSALKLGGVSVATLGQKVLGHIGLFAVLGALLRHRGVRLGPAALALGGLGIATEVSQLLAVARSPSPVDVLFDLVGTLLGWTFAQLVLRPSVDR